MNRDLARKLNLRLTPLARTIYPTGFNGKQLEGGSISYTTSVTITYQHHVEAIRLYVTNTGRHDLILGQPWLYRHKVAFDYQNQVLRFNSSRCQAVCLRRHLTDTRTRTLSEVTGVFRKTSSEPPSARTRTESAPNATRPMDINHIGSAPFMTLARRPDHEIYAISIADIDKALAPKAHTDPKTKVPLDYHDLLHVFSRTEADKLPIRRPYDHQIKLEPGKQPGYGPLYGMSLNELKVLRKYLDDNLTKGFIRASSSPVASPVLFVKKPGGGLRFCVDYRGLNALTIKNRYPIPLLQETLNRLCKAKFYTKLDIIAAFNKLRIAKGDEWLTAFRTRYGLFEYLVMPFGLANAPSTFQHYVNDALRPYLDLFCTAYIDDILIYSNNLLEHKQHVRLVLKAMEEAGLQLDVDKCEFHKSEVTYLGYVISTDGIRMDPNKVKTIIEWEYPRNVKDVRAFIGFANFYRRFIDEFSELVSPMIVLTKKDARFNFDTTCQQAFDRLKKAFTEAPILQHFDPDLPILVEADASDYVVAGVLSQSDIDGVIRPIAYFSKRMSPAEGNYEIYDKELLAIVRCFEQWRPELEGAAHPIQVLSDHKNLQYFTTTKQLSHRQARWSEYLSRFNFTITYRPGKNGEKPDALTRRSQDVSAQDEARQARNQTLLRPELFSRRLEAPEKTSSEDLHELNLNETDRSITQIIDEGYSGDEFIQETLVLLRNGTQRSKRITLSDCEDRNGRLYYRDRLVIPSSDELKIKLLRLVHESPAGGHPGRGKTLDILQREYYWPRMFDTVRRFVACCHICRKAKASREKYHGLLKPLPIPDRSWKDISVDFVTDLPLSEGCMNIMVVVDRLTKYRYLIPCASITAPAMAQLFYRHVWVHRGLPTTIVSDRGTQFVSAFWDELCKQLKIDARLSTAFHPETDGQTENANAVMEQVLRAYTNYQQDDWVTWLPTAQFEANNTTSESTRVSPFLANSGQHPRMGFEPPSDMLRPLYQSVQVADANKMVAKIRDLTEFVREELLWAQALQQEHANRNRTPAPAYAAGDRVWLNAKNIRTNRQSKKLDWKNLGPFTVAHMVSSHAYRLNLPESMKIHPVFHVSLLRPAAPESDYLPGQHNPPPDPIVVDEELEYIIESVERIRYNKKRRIYEYLTRWTGYDELSWEPAESLRKTEAVGRFHTRYPTEPNPYPDDSD